MLGSETKSNLRGNGSQEGCASVQGRPPLLASRTALSEAARRLGPVAESARDELEIVLDENPLPVVVVLQRRPPPARHAELPPHEEVGFQHLSLGSRQDFHDADEVVTLPPVVEDLRVSGPHTVSAEQQPAGKARSKQRAQRRLRAVRARCQRNRRGVKVSQPAWWLTLVPSKLLNMAEFESGWSSSPNAFPGLTCVI